MSRVISAMLVLGMFASVVPAQVLAVEEEPAAVMEQQDVEQTEVQAPVVEEQEPVAGEPQGETQKIDDPVILSGKDTKKGLYTIYNKSDNVDVSYVYGFYWVVGHLGLEYDSNEIPAGGCFTTSKALDYASTLMVFFKVPNGYEAEVTFSKPYGEEPESPVLPLDENFPTQPATSEGLAYDFTSEIEQAKLDGYTHGFYYTYWSPYVGEAFSRWFDIELIPIEYQIEYNLNAGYMPEGQINPETYTVESEDITLNNPERDGYTFAGWTQDGEEAEPTKEMKIPAGNMGDLSFTAHWNVAISFDSKGGSAVNDLEGYTAKVINDRSLPTPERAGYAFQGWYDEKGNAVKELPEVFPNENVTYTAQWTKRTDLEYTVNYYKDSVAPENLIATDTNKGTFEDPISYTAGKYLPEGYAADKVTTSGATTIGADESKNVLNVVYGRRTDLSYTVNYVEDNTGKVLAGPDTVSGQTYGTEVTVYAKDIGGYSLMSTNPQKLSIGTGSNTITFYYREIGPDQPEVVTPSESPAPVAPVTPVTPVTPRTPTTPTTTVTTPTATPAPDAGDADEEEAEEEEVIEEEETPLTEEPAEEETITDEETPLAESASGWALLNLILAIVTVIGAVVLVIGYFAGYQTIWRLLSLIPAIGGVVAFFLTEDMSLPMAFVDNWTVLMVIIAVVQVVIAIMAMKDKEEDDEEA